MQSCGKNVSSRETEQGKDVMHLYMYKVLYMQFLSKFSYITVHWFYIFVQLYLHNLMERCVCVLHMYFIKI